MDKPGGEKLKLKESAKENLAYLGIIVMIVVGGFMIAFRNQSVEEIQKKTEMSSTQVSQKN